MIVKCEHCNAKLKVADSAFEKGIPEVLCPICKKKFKPQGINLDSNKEENKPTDSGNQKTSDAGWLVVHDENTPQQTFTLKEGEQIVGRKSVSRPCEIMIETNDDIMSRNHFVVTVKKKSSGEFEYSLKDYASRNYTFLNEVRLKQGDEYILQDGVTIQAGRTKIVFKSNKTVKTDKEATRLVRSQPKGKTVLVW